MSLTISQKTNFDGFPKPAELIEITGAHALEASDRAYLNLFYQRAHDSGRLAESGAKFEVTFAEARQGWSKHKGNERIQDSVDRLLRVIVTVPYISPRTGKPRTLKTHLFDFIDTDDEDASASTIRFGIPDELRPILLRSGRWGRIKAEVVCSMTSKYAITLYEMVQLRGNRDNCIEVFTYPDFRERLGVPPGAYEDGSNFRMKVIEPALLEVNGLSDFGVTIDLRRRHSRAAIHEVAVAWWRKQGDEFRAAMQERGRSKIGRKARLRGGVETIASGD